MSTFFVPLTTVLEVKPHPHADRLDIVKVYGWEVIAGRDNYKVGDKVVYVPVDSLLPQDLENKLFPTDSKIKLHKHRIKSIRIRGLVSQGLLINPKEVHMANYPLETNLANALQITKYEPPANEIPSHMGVKTSKKITNPNFHKYTSLENYKWYDRSFQEGELVYISEKLHGTNFRAGWVKNEPNTFWKKILNFFHALPEYEFCWGSHNVQIQGKLFHKGYYGVDIYTKMVKQYDLKNRIPKGYVIYGEIVGDKIQKLYNYGLGPDEHELYVFDVMKDGEYLSYHMYQEFCGINRLLQVPLYYLGPLNRNTILLHRDGDSAIGGQKIREGIVLKPQVETTCFFGRKVLKVISEQYYMIKDVSDFH